MGANLVRMPVREEERAPASRYATTKAKKAAKVDPALYAMYEMQYDIYYEQAMKFLGDRYSRKDNMCFVRPDAPSEAFRVWLSSAVYSRRVMTKAQFCERMDKLMEGVEALPNLRFSIRHEVTEDEVISFVRFARHEGIPDQYNELLESFVWLRATREIVPDPLLEFMRISREKAQSGAVSSS
jgi:hypothetical protein